MAFAWWMVAGGANAVMVFVYGWLAMVMLTGLVKGRQWRTNPIATSTAAIFVTCTIGHGVHLLHVALPALGINGAVEEAARVAFLDWRLLAWDLFTAVVAIWYFTLRSRLVLLFEGAALCADLQERQRRAQQLHDDVVQGLVRAKAALDLGRRDEGHAAVSETLHSAREIISGLLGKEALQPGGLRRVQVAGDRP